MSLLVNVYITMAKQQGRNNKEGKDDPETAISKGFLKKWQFEE
jgi:hypothetical protein